MTPAQKIAVLASGSGTNFEAIHDAILAGRLKAEIVAVVSDRPDAKVLEKAHARGLRAICVPIQSRDSAPPNNAPKRLSREDHESRILEELREWSPRFLVLAGYMRVLTSRLIEAFRDPRGYSRIVNIHPALLPAFPGTHGYAQAFRYGTQVSGATVHLVELEVDAGPICAQESFSIADCRSEAEVEERGKKIEHELYPRALNWILAEKFQLEQRGRPCVRPI